MQNEQENFLKDLGSDQDNNVVDILDQPLTEEVTGDDGTTVDADTTTTDDDEDTGIKPRNRRERRLLRKLQSERESAIFLAGKLEAREEAKRVINEESDYLKAIERIYGTETPDAILATDLLKKAILGARDDAKRDAIAEFKAERDREKNEEMQAARVLDDIMTDIEDTYDVNLTEPQERSFMDLLKKMSPKDAEGRVISYADPHAVWDIFKEKMNQKTSSSRAKTLSSRSMVQSGTQQTSTLPDDTHARFLRENGII